MCLRRKASPYNIEWQLITAGKARLEWNVAHVPVSDGTPGGSARLYVCLKNDRRKLPVQIRVRMPTTVGALTLVLDKYE